MTDGADGAEIMAAQTAYGAAIDCREWEWFRDLFTTDVVADYRIADGTKLGTWEGLDAWLEAFIEIHEPLIDTQHMMLSHLAKLDGDRGKAFCYGLIKVRYRAKPQELVTMTGYYDDEVRREGGIWKICKRTFQGTLYYQYSPIPEGQQVASAMSEAAAGRISFRNPR